MAERVVVAGGGMSGLAAAEELEAEGFDVVLIDRRDKHVYRPGILSMINGRSESDLSFSLADHLDNTEIKYQREEITGFQTSKKTVETTEDSYSYDYLVVALGGQVREPSFSLNYTQDFYSIESAESALEELEDGESALVIGAGFTGIEAALRLDSEGVKTSLVDRSTRPLSERGHGVSEKVLDLLNSREVSFMGGKEVAEVPNYGVEFADGTEKEADVVVWCGGLKACKIVQEDFDTDEEGIKVNRGLSAVDFEDVYAVGKSADIEGSTRAAEAVRQGRKAARNIGRREGLLEDYEFSEGNRFISSPGSGVLIRGESVFSGRSANLLDKFSEKLYFTGMWKRRFLNDFDVFLFDPLLSMMDSREKKEI